MISEAIKRAVEGQDLGRAQMHEVFGAVMDGRASDVQKSALLVALRMKGETPEEITGAALAMRERVTPLDVQRDDLVDTCGTGGDGRGTFNISTIAALVAAGAGANVAKHGNRAVSSSCGSADVLAALGVHIDLNAAQMSDVLRKAGIAFLFAPKLHPAMAAVASVRRELGLRTIFNVLGPLTNPAFAKRQVLGVYNDRLVDVVARVLAALGATHALVVHSRDGLDEISVSAATHVCEVRGGEVTTYEVTPEELGVGRHSIEALAGGDARTNANIAREILQGANGAKHDVVVANAGAALYVAGAAPSIRDGVALAKEAIASGRAYAKLQQLVQETNALGGAA
ncbi:MAG TPA: anthranilate phosphoribosyltransferase [Thermoanaerobaculia bacterium]|jgi:anthranilate phosphoribosyltransferase|nr:anthranilate phosphoribosyltransferase [Thermoanaerobaculia bacterium]